MIEESFLCFFVLVEDQFRNIRFNGYILFTQKIYSENLLGNKYFKNKDFILEISYEE